MVQFEAFPFAADIHDAANSSLMDIPCMEKPLLIATLSLAGEVFSLHSPVMPQAGNTLQQYLGHSLEALLAPESLPEFQAGWQSVVAHKPSSDELTLTLSLSGGLLKTCWVIQRLESTAPGLVIGVAYGTSDAAPQQLANCLRVGNTAQDCSELQTYAARLNQLTRNIRRTLDLETIWHQTIDGLVNMFPSEHCLICVYNQGEDSVKVVAASGNPVSLNAFQPEDVLTLDQHGYLRRALACHTPVIDTATLGQDSQQPVLAMATRYQDHANGIIILFPGKAHQWSPVEQDLITELGEQVGTAIAHARLFGESHALAVKLKQANARLMEKHRELEEARRQAEETRKQAEEASRLKSEFLANTSHELRTPLNGMIGFLKLVLDGMADDPEEQEEFIREAHTSAIHLLTLINDVLDIAKIEAGKMQIDMGPITLRELLANVETFIRPQAEQKGLYFKILMPTTRDEIILHGNYQRLLQVMLNLVGNAIKFTHEGGITVTAEVKSQKVDFQNQTWPGVVKVSVADTGIGVSLEKQDRLFQTFSQVDGERTRQYGGTGLGLAISQKLVEAMGGVVQFISMGEGLGSTVTFTTLLYQEPVMISTEPVQPVS